MKNPRKLFYLYPKSSPAFQLALVSFERGLL
nr:MAG TPA: hypothetical protein [Caudoviricetes sp.]